MMGSDTMIYEPSFIKIGLRIQKLMGEETHLHGLTDSKVIS
jgi:hypothetical protein